MGYRHSREEMLATALRAVAEEGLAGLTYRRLAARLGVPDRTVVYYFPTKQDLLRAVLEGHAHRLMALLSAALGDEPLEPAELLHRAWPALKTDEADAAFRVFLEVIGHAAAGDSPHRELGAALAGEWTDWLAARITASPGRRHQQAAALLAQLDGLLVLRLTGQPRLADAAAEGLWRGPEGGGSARGPGSSPST